MNTVALGMRVKTTREMAWWDTTKHPPVPAGALGTVIEFPLAPNDPYMMCGVRFDDHTHPSGWECGMRQKPGDPLPTWLEVEA